MRHGLCIALLLALVIPPNAAPADDAVDMRRKKKLIQVGWDKPDTERLLQNLEEMEKRPFDGVVVEAVGKRDDGKPCSIRYAHQQQDWKREWFQPCIDHMKACRFKRFTDNFLLVNANPGKVDWFDDEGWKSIEDHWRIAAWVAKEGGFKGILFDPEPYAKPYAQFRYAAQAECDKHTFNEYYAKARERGRQVMQAIVEEYPDLTIFCFFLDIACSTATGHKDPRELMASMAYGLLPPFVDGWLDVMPPTVTVVDGCEWAYHFNSDNQYLEAALKIKGPCQELVSPENRAKYRAQMQVSFGTYLDAYWNPKDSKWGRWYIDGLGGPRVDRLRANVTTALRVADEYVWIYGEKFRWWPTPSKRVWEKTWPEGLPGSEKALRFARDPLDYARIQIAALAKDGKLVNLARNGDFTSDKAPAATPDGPPIQWKEGQPPAGWTCWQHKDSKGTFTWYREAGAAAKGSARAAGVSSGCFIQSYPVKPGEVYAIQAVRRIRGEGRAQIRVRWQTPEGRWTLQTQDVFILSDAPNDQWGEMLGAVQIPEGVGKLVLLLGAADQRSADDVIWYDDVRVYKLE